MGWDFKKECKLVITSYDIVGHELKLMEGLVPKVMLPSKESQTVISTCYAETRKGRKLCSSALDDMLKTTPSYEGVYRIVMTLYGGNVKTIELEGKGKVRVEVSCKFSDDLKRLLTGDECEQTGVFLREFNEDETLSGEEPNGNISQHHYNNFGKNYNKLAINLGTLETKTQTPNKDVSQTCTNVKNKYSTELSYAINNIKDLLNEYNNDVSHHEIIKNRASTPIIKQKQSLIVGENIFIRGDLGVFKVVLCELKGLCSEEFVSSDVVIGGAYYTFKSPGNFSMTVVHEVPSHIPSVPYFSPYICVKVRFDKPIIFGVNGNALDRALDKTHEPEEMKNASSLTKTIFIKGTDKGAIKYAISEGIVSLESFCINKIFEQDSRCIMINKDFDPNDPPKVSSSFTVVSYIKAREGDDVNADSEVSILFSDLQQIDSPHLSKAIDKPKNIGIKEEATNVVYMYEDELPKQLVNSLIIGVVVFITLVVCALVFIFIVPSWNSMIKVYLSTVKMLKKRNMIAKGDDIEPLQKNKFEHGKYENDKKYSQALKTANDWINRYDASNTVAGGLPSAPVTPKITKNALELPITKFNVVAFRNINKTVDVTDEGEIIPVCYKCNFNSDILYTCAECSLKAQIDNNVEIYLLCPDCAHEHIVHEHDIEACEFPSCNRVMFCSKCNKIKPHLFLDGSKAFFCKQCATRKTKKCLSINLCGECYLSAASIICLTCDKNLCPSCDWRTHISSKATNHSRLNANLKATPSPSKEKK